MSQFEHWLNNFFCLGIIMTVRNELYKMRQQNSESIWEHFKFRNRIGSKNFFVLVLQWRWATSFRRWDSNFFEISLNIEYEPMSEHFCTRMFFCLSVSMTKILIWHGEASCFYAAITMILEWLSGLRGTFLILSLSVTLSYIGSPVEFPLRGKN